MNVRLIASITGGFTLAILAACSVETTTTPGSSTTSSTSSSGGASSPPITTAACQERCSTKLTACKAPEAQIEPGCQQLCGQTITEEQASCFEGKDCEDIAQADSIDELCPKSTTSSSSGGSSSGGSSSGSTSGDLPDTLTIKGTLPSSLKANHVLDDDKSPPEIYSLITFAPEPTLSPELPAGVKPDVAADGVTFTIDEPSPGACDVTATFVYNPSQIGGNISGTDKGADADCAKLTDDIAKGRFKATLKNVPYVGGLGPAKKATVIIDLN